MIKIEHLKKAYPDATPLKDVNAEIGRGEVVSVIGPSGTGKSTLLRCLNLLETPTGGRIFIGGEEITDPKCDLSRIRRKMGMVFQQFNLFGHMTVIENVMYAPVKLLGRTRQQAYDDGIRLLSEVGMAGRALHYPEELSGGQKQRVAIARTLAMDPDVILLDEPTSALDPTMVGEVQAVIRDLAKSGKTMLIVTHEMSFARAISNRVFYMDQGGIYEDGTPEQVFDRPQKELTRRFIRQLKVLELAVDSRDFDFIGAGTQIDLYCLQNDIPPKEKYRIRLVIEELVQQILLAEYPEPDIRVTVEYAPDAQTATVFADYAGKRFDPRDTKNDLSLTVLTGAAEKIDYTYDDARQQNRVAIRLK